MNGHLDKFVIDLKGNLGENLVSVILYGSAAKGGRVPEHSDLNVLVVLGDATLAAIDSMEKTVLAARKNARIFPVFWGINELKTSSDVFPMEFEDISRNNKVLFGADIFKDVAIDKKDLRHQIEFELRSKLLQLRGEWFSLKNSKSLLADFLMRSGTSFLHIFPHAQGLLGGKLNEALAEPFRECVRMKKGGKQDLKGLAELYDRAHLAVCKIIAEIDKA